MNSLPDQASPSKRIEYIDAMRGFTMMLVVMSHVASWGIGDYGYNTIFTTFRMPLFFFVSGFVFFKPNIDWCLQYTVNFIKKKVSVQILSPFLFFLAYCIVQGLNIADGLTSESKCGYWFTYTLFEFFILYIGLQYIFRLFHIHNKVQDAAYILIGLALYVLMHHKVIGHSTIVTTLGMVQWRYFIFFIIGTLTHKYFIQFENLLDKTPLVMACIILFFGLNIYPILEHVNTYLNRLVLALSGITIIFACFRHFQDTFSSKKRIGRVFQYVGRRTLDIYLIHFFFVYKDLASTLQAIPLAESPFIAFIVSIFITICVIAACLGVSQILRLSPTLAHFLFGQKKN